MNHKPRNKFIRVFSMLFMILMLVTLSSCYFRTDDNVETYRIKFYDGREYVDSVIVNYEDSITEEQLEVVESKLYDYGQEKETYYVWSINPDRLEYADFDKICWNETVYLYRIKEYYDVNVNESTLFDYEILNVETIRYGDDVNVRINPNVDLDNYHMDIYINDEKVELQEDNVYTVEYITDDINIEVIIKEIINIVPIVEEIEYDGKAHYATYEVRNNKGELIEDDEIVVQYYLGNKEKENMTEAGSYTVLFTYIGDKYYVEDTVVAYYKVGKNEPTIEVIEKEFYYNGSLQGYTLNDIITNSDGKVTLINNMNKNVGVYDVIIKLEETDNYYGKEIHITQTINKGIPQILELPKAETGFEGYVLNTVEVTGGKGNVDGQFIWSNGNKKLEIGTHSYDLLFVPNDNQYETIEVEIPVETITIQEALRRIKEERIRLENTYGHILEDDVYQIEDLYVVGIQYPVKIDWISSSTIVSINQYGYVSILDVEGEYDVELTAVMTYGDTAEYAVFNFTLHLEEVVKEVKHAPRHVEETRIPTLDEIGKIVQANNKGKAFDILTSYDVVSYNDKNSVTHHYEFKQLDDLQVNILRTYLDRQEANYVYHSRCNRHREISEVILWRIISDGASDGNGYINHYLEFDDDLINILCKITSGDYIRNMNNPPGSKIYLKLESKQKDIYNFMKGEN